MVHKTPTNERIKQLHFEIQELDVVICDLNRQERSGNARELQDRLIKRRKAAQAEATALQDSRQARLEDLSVFKIKKVTKKGKKKGNEREYWYSAWSIGGRTRNIYLGGCHMMSYEEALENAKKMKAKELGITKITA